MAMRRPKRLARRNRPSPSDTATRLGPGMETLELRFTPPPEREKRGFTAAKDGIDSTHIYQISPWIIEWEVGIGASVDRGLKLANVFRRTKDGSARLQEHAILGEQILQLLPVTEGALKASSDSACNASQETVSTQCSSTLTQDTTASDDTESCPQETADSFEWKKEGEALLQPRDDEPSLRRESSAVEEKLNSSVIIGRLSYCGHPELHGTLCTSCGRKIVTIPEITDKNGSQSGSSTSGSGARGGTDAESGYRERAMSKVTMKGGGTLTLSSTAAKKMHMDKRGRLVSTKKLSLVLDLDNTLLHCSDHPDAGRVTVPGMDGIYAIRLPDQPREYYIKLRPGLRTFLAQAATMFEMTIYTAGTSQYADAVARVLDPDRSLFQGRHFSTCYTPDLGRNTKSLERIFPYGLDMALIMDDRDDVWRGQQARNLLLVRPYKFFVGQRSVPEGPTHEEGSLGLSTAVPPPLPPENSSEQSPGRSPPSHSAGGYSDNARTAENGTQERESTGGETEEKGALDDATPGGSKVDGNKDHATTDESDRSKRMADSCGNLGNKEGKSECSTIDEDHLNSANSSAQANDKQREELMSPRLGEKEIHEKGWPAKPTLKAAHMDLQAVSSRKENDGSSFSTSHTMHNLSQRLAELIAKKREQAARTNTRTDSVAQVDGSELGSKRKSGTVNLERNEHESPTKKPLSPRLHIDSPKDIASNTDPSEIFNTAKQLTLSGDPKRSPHRQLSKEQHKGMGEKEVAESATSVPIEEDTCMKGSQKGSTKRDCATAEASCDEKGQRIVKSNTAARPQGIEGTTTPMSPPVAASRSVGPQPLMASLGYVENDPQLDCTLKTLEAVHGAYFAPENCQNGQPRDVAHFLAKVRSRVLRGVRMVFSGVIPLSGVPSDPRTHRLWRLAEAHGATIETSIGAHTTHVVAARLGTAKTNAGLRMPGVFVVHVDWLMNSVWHCRRERETLFLLAGQICAGVPPPQPLLPISKAKDAQLTSSGGCMGGSGGGGDGGSDDDDGGGGDGICGGDSGGSGGDSDRGSGNGGDCRGSRDGSDAGSDGVSVSSKDSDEGKKSYSKNEGEGRKFRRSPKRRRDEKSDQRDGSIDTSNRVRVRTRKEERSKRGGNLDVGAITYSNKAPGTVGSRSLGRTESSGSERSRSGSFSSCSVTSTNDGGSTGSDLMALVDELES